mmetsp:Transcript_8262/g.16743  ORF Transcript_8262/g.16743 Transcript_8262/m.16743 type:complete len:111 (-) Transcript_8262:790-1122(-)
MCPSSCIFKQGMKHQKEEKQKQETEQVKRKRYLNCLIRMLPPRNVFHSVVVLSNLIDSEGFDAAPPAMTLARSKSMNVASLLQGSSIPIFLTVHATAKPDQPSSARSSLR